MTTWIPTSHKHRWNKKNVLLHCPPFSCLRLYTTYGASPTGPLSQPKTDVSCRRNSFHDLSHDEISDQFPVRVPNFSELHPHARLLEQSGA